ncbi:MAG: M23 family metallopeptidase [Candidatus Dadabacteria bacterium]|nr:MAG: M23 family metallopeptidase [Candidatus Dadabacteria bacterium]
MSWLSDKSFCLWVVPPDDGRVRKVRITTRRLLALSVIVLFVISSILFVISDYGRVQVLRAKNYLLYKKISSERYMLAKTNASLKSRLEKLSESNSRVLKYEKSLNQRLDELRSIIEGAGVYDIFSTKKDTAKNNGKIDSSNGIGGAEITCSGKQCSDLSGQDSSDNFLRMSSNPANEDLLELFDRYIQFLSTLPLGSPGNGYLSSGFGLRVSPFSHRVAMHQGVDISLPYGSQVVATGDGVIEAVRRTRTYGLVVDIKHSNKISTRYAHLSRVFVTEGEKICKGEVVGLVGSTGRSTGPHLHYEVRINKKPHDPRKFIELGKKLAKLL